MSTFFRPAKETFLNTEARLEETETMGDVRGDFQGGAVDVITADEVDSWKTTL